MKMIKNMMWMMGGVGVGIMCSKYSKDIMKFMKKSKKEVCNMIEDN